MSPHMRFTSLAGLAAALMVAPGCHSGSSSGSGDTASSAAPRPLPVPVSLTAKAAPFKVKLAWAAPQGGGFDGYVITRNGANVAACQAQRRPTATTRSTPASLRLRRHHGAPLQDLCAGHDQGEDANAAAGGSTFDRILRRAPARHQPVRLHTSQRRSLRVALHAHLPGGPLQHHLVGQPVEQGSRPHSATAVPTTRHFTASCSPTADRPTRRHHSTSRSTSRRRG